MATINATTMSILDAAKLFGADGMILNVAELLSQRKGMLEDISWKATDAPESHVSAQRTSLATPSNIVYNSEIVATKSTVANIIESVQGLRTWLTPDADVLNYGGNPGGKMAVEIAGAVEGMKQAVQTKFITGNGDTTVGDMYGFYSRMTSLSANNARNILDCDGTGSDNASILYVRWSPETIYGLYPKGTPAGLEMKDYGVQAVTTSSGEIVRHKYRLSWFFGVSVDDWRQMARACNIDIPALLAGTGADLQSRMRDLMSAVEDNSHGKGAFYMNRTVHAALARQCRTAVQAGGGLTFSNADGEVRESFDGVPIRIIDAMPITESRVT